MFYEIIVQVGDFEDMNAVSENGKLAEKILHQYMKDFQERNPTLYVFSAHLHMDEATPHLHIDFVPYTKENKRGLEIKTTLKGALNQLGYGGGTKSSTELNQWQDAEKEVVANIMLEHGIEWEKKGMQRKHLSVEQFKAEQKAVEVEKLEQTIEQKTEKLSKVETKLTSVLQDVKTIDNNIHKFDEDVEWQLPEPTLLMTAGAYKDKKAAPLVSALKEYIKGLTVKFVQMKSALDHLKKENTNLIKQIDRWQKTAKEKTMGDEKYRRLENIIGQDEINRMIRVYEQNTPKKQLDNMKNKESER